jgi:hypothetical protein
MLKKLGILPRVMFHMPIVLWNVNFTAVYLHVMLRTDPIDKLIRLSHNLLKLQT